MNGRILPNGEGRSDSGNASKAAMINPTTRTINPEMRVCAETRARIDLNERTGRVVTNGVNIRPIRAPTSPDTRAYNSREYWVSVAPARYTPVYNPRMARTSIPMIRKINSILMMISSAYKGKEDTNFENVR
jgi:hypothetical protein